MTDLQKPTVKVLADTIDACVTNGNKLTDKSYDLEFREPPIAASTFGRWVRAFFRALCD